MATPKVTSLTYQQDFTDGLNVPAGKLVRFIAQTNAVKVSFSRDGVFVYLSPRPPFQFEFTPTDLQIGESHKFTAVPIASNGTKGTPFTRTYNIVAAAVPPPVIKPAYAAWTQVAGATGYKISWGTISRTYPYTADCGNTTVFQIPNLAQGVNYFVTGQSYNTTETSSYGNEVAITL